MGTNVFSTANTQNTVVYTSSDVIGQGQCQCEPSLHDVISGHYLCVPAEGGDMTPL